MYAKPHLTKKKSDVFSLKNEMSTKCIPTKYLVGNTCAKYSVLLSASVKTKVALCDISLCMVTFYFSTSNLHNREEQQNRSRGLIKEL